MNKRNGTKGVKAEEAIGIMKKIVGHEKEKFGYEVKLMRAITGSSIPRTVSQAMCDSISAFEEQTKAAHADPEYMALFKKLLEYAVPGKLGRDLYEVIE